MAAYRAPAACGGVQGANAGVAPPTWIDVRALAAPVNGLAADDGAENDSPSAALFAHQTEKTNLVLEPLEEPASLLRGYHSTPDCRWCFQGGAAARAKVLAAASVCAPTKQLNPDGVASRMAQQIPRTDDHPGNQQRTR